MQNLGKRRTKCVATKLFLGSLRAIKNTQPLYIFNRENPQNSEPQNGPRSGLDYIALEATATRKLC